jgi:hypothetical protein
MLRAFAYGAGILKIHLWFLGVILGCVHGYSAIKVKMWLGERGMTQEKGEVHSIVKTLLRCQLKLKRQKKSQVYVEWGGVRMDRQMDTRQV